MPWCRALGLTANVVSSSHSLTFCCLHSSFHPGKNKLCLMEDKGERDFLLLHNKIPPVSL